MVPTPTRLVGSSKSVSVLGDDSEEVAFPLLPAGLLHPLEYKETFSPLPFSPGCGFPPSLLAVPSGANSHGLLGSQGGGQGVGESNAGTESGVE